MKRFTICLLLIVMSKVAFNQTLLENNLQPNIDYLKKSKGQKTAAWLLTAAGTAGLIITTSTELSRGLSIDLGPLFGAPSSVVPDNESYEGPYLASAVGILAGVGFFIAAAQNKRKAKALAAATFKMEKASVFQNGQLRNGYYPAVCLTIDIRK